MCLSTPGFTAKNDYTVVVFESFSLFNWRQVSASLKICRNVGTAPH